MKVTAIIEKDEDWYIGQIAEIPAAISQGRTKKELIENLKDAAKMVIESNRKKSFKNIKRNKFEEKEIYLVA